MKAYLSLGFFEIKPVLDLNKKIEVTAMDSY